MAFALPLSTFWGETRASTSASEYGSESEYGSLVALGLLLVAVRPDSGMVFGLSVGAVSVGEQCTFNIEIHTWLEGHGLIVPELYTQLDWPESCAWNTYIGEFKTNVLVLTQSLSVKGVLYEGRTYLNGAVGIPHRACGCSALMFGRFLLHWSIECLILKGFSILKTENSH